MEKDEYWNSIILWFIALGCMAAMVLGKYAPSWSQNHTTDWDFLLYGALIAIFGVYLIRSFAHPKQDDVAFIWPMVIRNRHINRITAFSFMGVAIFGVLSPFWWVETLHLVFTFAAIASGMVGMIYYFPKGKRQGAILGAVIGSVGFLIGLITNYYSIAEGEGIVALPLAVWLILTTKIDK